MRISALRRPFVSIGFLQSDWGLHAIWLQKTNENDDFEICKSAQGLVPTRRVRCESNYSLVDDCNLSLYFFFIIRFKHFFLISFKHWLEQGIFKSPLGAPSPTPKHGHFPMGKCTFLSKLSVLQAPQLESLWSRFGVALESLWSRFLVVVFIGFS